MINAIPFIGWLISLFAAIGLSVPFWFLWTVCGLGQTYFWFVAKPYQVIPFWHCVGLFMVASILKSLVPKLASVHQSVSKEK